MNTSSQVPVVFGKKPSRKKVCRVRRFLLLLSVLLTLQLAVNSAVGASSTGQNQGYWQLTSKTFDQASETDEVSINLSENYASYRIRDQRTGDVFAASASWTMPQETYGSGEKITLTLNIEADQYDWHGQEGSFHPGLNFMGMHISARFDAPGVAYGFAGNSSIGLQTEENDHVAEVAASLGTIHNASDSITVSADFPRAYEDGYQTCLYVSPSSCGNVCFLYTWHAEEVPVETTEAGESESDQDNAARQIWFTGMVTDVENRIMPRLKLKIDIYYNADSWSPGTASPDKSLSLITDIAGKFFVEINIPSDQEKDMGLLMQTELACVLADNHEAFAFANMKYPAAQDKIVAASFIRVPVANQDNRERAIIPIGRKYSFYYLCVDAFSFDKRTADPFWSNVPDYYELAAASYLYNALWDALLFGTVRFDEGNNLKQATVKVETYWTPGADNQSKTSHYQVSDAANGTIRLVDQHSGFDDNARFTILHEFGHHFDSISNNGKLRAVSLDTSGNMVNHRGYMNPSTADSFMEGLATAYAVFVQDFRKDQNPHIAGPFNLEKPGNYVAWKDNGQYEELAIAALLYDMYKGYPDKAAFWKLLKPNYVNFYKYYQAIEADLASKSAKDQSASQRLAQLRNAAMAGGLFTMPYGDGQYNLGEPFLDKVIAGTSSGDGSRSADEVFADLMFAANAGNWIEEDTPLRTPPADMNPGQSSDALRSRETIQLIPNSYLYFENMTDEIEPYLTRLVVTIRPKSGQPSKQLLTLEGDRIYLGLTSQSKQGKVTVSLPGGKTLYEGDLWELQMIRASNYGLSVPLATVDLGELDQKALQRNTAAFFGPDDQQYDRWARPCYGSARSDERIALPTFKQIRQGNDDALFKPGAVQKHVTPAYLADIEYGRLKPHPLRIAAQVFLGYIILQLVVAGVFLIIRAKRKKKHQIGRENH